MNVARVSVRHLSRAAIFPRRQIHTSPIALAKKKKASNAVVDDLFDDEQWGAVEDDLIPSGPTSASSPAVVVSTSTSPAPAAVPKNAKKDRRQHLSPAERRHDFTVLVNFVRPRIGRHPRKKTPLPRRSVFPQLFQLAMTADHLRTITALMIPWKEGRLGTQGKARIGPDGQPKGAHPFDESTSELFARRCAEFGIPEHALEVFGAFSTYGLPLTLPAARRLLHALDTAGRPLSDIVTASVLYGPYGLPPVHEDLPSCALLLSACLRHLKAAEESKERIETQELVEDLIAALRARLQSAEPMPESRDVRDKTVRRWLKAIMRDVNAFLQGTGGERAWLEEWMARSRFLPNPSPS
ncbi:hypothetical protein FB451DRAFT_1399676 [Mycena latifolia]|nr:hypothetical protein FB451DRAFT_1399676 [Mycena latifolia]